MTNRAIERLCTIFAILFVILIVRQAYVQLVLGPTIEARPYNPRHTLPNQHRGEILATDGTVLAQTIHGKRVYPLGAALAQTLGYVSPRYGTSGLESAYDRALTPPETTGDPVAQFQEIVASFEHKQTLAQGADIVTTIVPSIQRALYAQLSHYSRAAGVVLDPQSGAVLAISSVPSFNPNTIDANFPQLIANTQSPLLNRALDGLYPPGSTFKILTLGAALDSATVTPDSHFEDPGYLQIGNFLLHDNESEATGYADVTTAFALSSNVDFAQITLKMGLATFYQYIAAWGIGGSLDFQLPAARDRVPPQNTIVPGELAQMGFGQGALLMTPLQMALIGATIAAGGREPRPYIVRQIVRNGAVASVYSGSTLATPISADTAAEVKKMMVAVVDVGTGTSAQLPGIAVAGKTGTATNPRGASDAWFVSFAPAGPTAQPRVAVAIVVENVGYGATYAAPIARDVMRTTLRVESESGVAQP